MTSNKSTAPTGAKEPVLLREDRDGIATLVLNRPRQRNSLNRVLLTHLESALLDIANDSSVRVVIIGANGPVFSAGHDMKELRANPALDYYEQRFHQSSRVMRAILGLPQPAIARVQGTATAAGCLLVASCDLALASTQADFATPGVHIGLFCSTPMVGLSRNVARKHAMEMLLTGDPIGAEEAARIGLINGVAAPDDLDGAVEALARKIASKSAHTISLGKQAFYEQLDLGMADAFDYASGVMARNMLTDDAVEGIDAFLEKREPRWAKP